MIKIAAIKNVKGLKQKKKKKLMNLKAERAEVIMCINFYKSATMGKNFHNTTTSLARMRNNWYITGGNAGDAAHSG